MKPKDKELIRERADKPRAKGQRGAHLRGTAPAEFQKIINEYWWEMLDDKEQEE